MPKVLLTEAQRLEARYTRIRKCIGDRLATVKNRERFSQEQLAKRIGVSRGTVSKLLSGEEAVLDSTTWLKLVDIAGLALVDKRKDEISKEAEQ